MSKIILAYCNQPIFRVHDKYYTPHANFIDFLAYWTRKNSKSRLAVPVSIRSRIEHTWVELTLQRQKVIEVSSYNSHFGAIIFGFLNAIRFRKCIYDFEQQYSTGFSIVLPSPNAFSATLSCITGAKIASISLSVIRGNSLKTVSHMYANHKVKWLVVGLSKFFLKRLDTFQQRGAKALCFGDDLTESRRRYGPSLSITPLIESLPNPSNAVMKTALDRNKKLSMLYIGRLSHEKGLVELMDTLEQLVDAGYIFNMLIAGHGPLKEHIENRTTTAKLKPHVRFVGRLSPGVQVFKTMDEADVLLLPSKTEGVPRVIVESLSRGLIVITTAVGGIKPAFGSDVLYFNSHKVSDLTDTISQYLENPTLLNQYRSANSLALKRFTFEDNIERIEKSIHN